MCQADEVVAVVHEEVTWRAAGADDDGLDDPLGAAKRRRPGNGGCQNDCFTGRGDGENATVPDNGSETPSAEEQPARGDGPAAVTIAYIAETAGVSVPTVSKVLNGRSGASDETRARIEELIARYGYRKPPKNRSHLPFARAARRRAVRGGHEPAGRPGRDPAPGRTGASSHRHDQRS
nr:helix-turn-helix domain-containing protein [Streptomyces guryensis]